MTDGTDNPQATDIPDTPPTLAEGLLQDGQFLLMLANILLNVTIGLSACWLGLSLARTL